MREHLLDLESEGKTVVSVYYENRLVGLIAVADTLRANAKYLVDEIKKTNREIILGSCLQGAGRVVTIAKPSTLYARHMVK
ncbi:MAG: hypothetical protein ACJ704_05450 [Nitrososphaeraceae archaeon]